MRYFIYNFLLLCVIGSFFAQCTAQKGLNGKTFYDASVRVDEANYPLDSLQHYFPFIGQKDSIAPKDSGVAQYELISPYKDDRYINSFRNTWYSAQLYAMKEPLLYNKPMKKEVVRFTWLRTFAHPVAVRMEKEGGTCVLYWKMCDGAGGYEPGKLVANGKKKLSQAEWEILNSKLDKAGFRTSGFKKRDIGLDGSEWIFEAAGPGYYQVKSIWNGEELRETGEYLLSLTDMGISKEEIY